MWVTTQRSYRLIQTPFKSANKGPVYVVEDWRPSTRVCRRVHCWSRLIDPEIQ